MQKLCIELLDIGGTETTVRSILHGVLQYYDTNGIFVWRNVLGKEDHKLIREDSKQMKASKTIEKDGMMYVYL